MIKACSTHIDCLFHFKKAFGTVSYTVVMCNRRPMKSSSVTNEDVHGLRYVCPCVNMRFYSASA